MHHKKDAESGDRRASHEQPRGQPRYWHWPRANADAALVGR
jgi:hypothetical protein